MALLPLRRIILLPLLLSLFSIIYLLLYLSYSSSPDSISVFPSDIPVFRPPPSHPHFPSLPSFPNLNPYFSRSPSWGGGTTAVAGPKKQTFEILTFITHETTYDHISHSNKNAYADKHGYALTIDYATWEDDELARANPVWHKIAMMQDAIERSLTAEKEKEERYGGDDSKAAVEREKWFWWIDWDTIITNTTVGLEELVMEGRERLGKGFMSPDDEVDDDGNGVMGKVVKKRRKRDDEESTTARMSRYTGSHKDADEESETEELEREQLEDQDEDAEIDAVDLNAKDLNNFRQGAKGKASIEESDLEMILTADCKPINAGSILFRPTPTLFTFLTRVRQCGFKSLRTNSTLTPFKNEQDCIRELLFPTSRPSHNSQPLPHTILLPQTRMNSYPQEITLLSNCYDSEGRAWRPGDFVVHFAGAWAHLKTSAERKKENEKSEERRGKGYVAEIEEMAGGVVGEMADIIGRVGFWKGLMRYGEETKGKNGEGELKGDELVKASVEEVEKDRYGPLMRKYAKLVDVDPGEDDESEMDLREGAIKRPVDNDDDADGDNDGDEGSKEEKDDEEDDKKV